MSATALVAAAPLRLARQVRAHRLRAAVRLRRRVPRRRRLPGHRQHHLAHARDDRRPHAGDGAQPARRRRARRPQPAHRLARDPGRHPEPGAGLGAVRRRARALPRGRVPARADRALALADPGRDVRHLPLFEADHVALPPLARRLHGPRAARRLARRDGLGAVGGVGALRRAGALGRRLRPLLLALRPRARPGCRPALVGDAVRRAWRVHRRPHLPRHRRPAARRGRRRPRQQRLLLARRRGGGGPARLRAHARPSRRSPPARCGVLHRQRRDQRRLLRLRRPRDDGLCHADRYLAAGRRAGRHGHDDRGGRPREAVRPQAGPEGCLVQRPPRGLPARHRPERVGQDDAPAPRRRPRRRRQKAR